jgi:hypothetical protein
MGFSTAQYPLDRLAEQEDGHLRPRRLSFSGSDGRLTRVKSQREEKTCC